MQQISKYQIPKYRRLCCFVRGNDDATVIPPQCCAFPFILDGELYYNCTVNPAINNNLGCYNYNNNGQWVTCDEPEGMFLLLSTYLSGEDLPQVSSFYLFVIFVFFNFFSFRVGADF